MLNDGSVAGARRTPGRSILEASSRTSSPATLSSPLPPLLPRVQNFLMDWAAGGRKSLLRRDLRRSIVSSMGLSSSMPGIPFHHSPSITQGSVINAFLAQGCGCVINAFWRCGTPSTGCRGAGPSGLSGPVALGPGIRVLVSGQSSSPQFLPGQCA